MFTASALKKLSLTVFSFLMLFCYSASSQIIPGTECDPSTSYLYWTGEADNDFFNERNWRVATEDNSGGSCNAASALLYNICPSAPDLVNNPHPDANTLEPGAPINFNLYIQASSVVASGDIIFACAQKGITLFGSSLTINNGTVTQGVISLNNESTVHLQQGTISASLSLNFLDAASWVYVKQDNPQNLLARVGNIFINDVAGVLNTNFRINQYYQNGSVVRPFSNSFAPVKIYSSANLQGSSADINEDIIYKGASLPNGMNNNISSFKLKRGFMATMAVNENGTGKSRVYIASESDLTVNTLDVALQGNVSFIRVVPWNWVTKKGTGFYYELDAGWYYNWNFTGNPTANTDYVPMAWGASGTFPSALTQMIAKKKTTHVLGFNESDNCDDQSGAFNNLCQPAVAVAYYENLMSLGVRLGTPAPRENGPSTWLKDFATIAKAKDVRFDFVAVHWYDWGSNPASTPNATAEQIFGRFKSYLQSVYNIYKLPIWITEFNANPNRPNPTQEEFLSYALPFLDTLSYVERYAYFQPNSSIAQVPTSSANYFDANGALTNIGTLYKNHSSTPSIPELTDICANNLDGLDQVYVSPTVNSLAFEAECGKYIGNQWVVTTDATASNEMYLKGNTSLAGATTLAKQIHFEFETSTAGTYRVYIRSASTGTGAIKMGMDGSTTEQLSPFTSSTFTWFQMPRFYDLGTGLHRLTIEFPNSNIKLDQIVITNGLENLEAFKKDAGYCTASNVKFGLDITDILNFHEAENTPRGSNWNLETSTSAVAGAYLKSANNITSPQPPVSTDNQITFTINIAQADEYELWAKIKAINAGENSLWIAVDDEPYRKWDHLGSTVYEWYWKKFHYSYGSIDRSFSYFLEAGQHVVKIAIAGGNVHVDRLAVATKGKNPETTDPNVLLLSAQLEFEAELAERFGTTTIQNCVNSSNGQQVTMGLSTSNGIRFNQIVAEDAGAYKLKVSYMSKVARNFRVRVNGTLMNRQTVVSSGNWCFIDASNPTLGSPAIHEVVVILRRGLNTIEITPAGTDAPAMDKIKLEKAPLTNTNLEAELAEMVGTTAIVACTTASNGSLANPGVPSANGIRYNNILCAETKTYDIDISYISKTVRQLRISVNGGAFVSYDFGPSGNWCFEGGSPGIKTIPLALTQGINTIEMRATGSADAPFLDKIVIKEQPISNVTFTTSGLPAGATSVNVTHRYYTNLTTLSAPLNLVTDFTAPVATNKEIYFSYPVTTTDPGGNVYSLTGVSVSGGTLAASSQPGYNNQFTPTQPRTITGAYELTCAVPSITTQPIDRMKTYGDTARFAFAGAGTAISYQWQINTGSGFVNITASENNPGNIYTGFNTVELDIASLTVSMSGYQFKCVVTNSCGTITTNTVSLTVNPLTATITANAKTKTYGNDNPALDAIVSGIINGDELSYTLATTAEKFSSVGNYPITVSLGTNANYDVIVNNNTLEIEVRNATVKANNKIKTYGDDNPVLDATVSGTVNGDFLSYDLNTTAQKFSDVGTYPINVTLGSNPNYNIASENANLQINTRNVTLAANNKLKTYGDDNPTLNATINGTVNDDLLNYSLATSAQKFSDVGNYPITVTLGSNPNYNISPSNATLQVDARNVTLTANNKSKTYGDDNPILDATVSGTVNGDMLNYSLATTAQKFSDVGNYPITVTMGSNPNYNVAPGNGNLQVEARNVTLTANNKLKTYGDDNPTLNATVVGTVNGDELNYSLATTAQKFSGIGNYPISVTLGLNPNYFVSPINGNLQIEKRTLTVTATTGASKVYDGNTAASVTTDAANTTANVKLSDNKVNDDAININFTSSNFNSKVVSTNHIITVSGITITGAGAANYDLSQTSVSTNNNAVITPRDITVTATSVDKVFDGNTVANVLLSTNKVAGDDVSASFTAANFADFNAGTWQVSVSGISISGNDATNYTLLNNTAVTSAKINKAGTATTLITSAATVRYMDPLTMTAKIKPANTGGVLTGTVQFSIGGVTYGSPIAVVPIPGDLEGMVQATMAPQVSNLPAVNPYNVTAVFTSTNNNYSGSTQSKPITVLQRNASPYNDNVGFYSGSLFAWTSGPNSSTASITLSTTIRDNSAPRGDMRGARVTFYLVNGTTLTPISGAQNLPVGLVDINDGSIGTASAIVQFNIGSNNAQNFLIAVGISGAYTNNPNLSSAQTIVTVSKPVPGGYMVGGGRIENISSSGYIRGKSGMNTDFQADITYTKSGTNPKGKANVLVRSYYKTDGTLDAELHTYIITTSAISSLNVGTPTATAKFSAKANLYEQMPDLSLVQIEGGSTFEMTIYQNQCNQKVAITLYRKAGGVWYSSNWNGTATIQQVLNGGEVAVAGGGSCIPVVTRKNNADEQIDLLPSLNLSIKAYPNPSTSYFTIKLEGVDLKQPINMRVLNINGKEVELRRNINAGQIIQFGNSYLPGAYILEVIQGEKKITTKLIKQAD
jgi:trimeric autotransporter adhesin